jgi:hypothetical protein
MQENNCLKLPQMSNYHSRWKNEQHVNIDYDFDNLMYLSKKENLVFQQLFTSFKVCCSIDIQPNDSTNDSPNYLIREK